MKYNAFISYSQRQDAWLASSLETGLEKFAKPTFKRRALDVFRDSNDLSASPDLWGKIEEGLDESEYFIFLASTKSAQSRWCIKEVDHWLKTKSIDQFLVVVTEGELHWDEAASDFDWEKTNNLPRNLSGAFKNDPLYVDFRDETPESELTLDHPGFKDKVVRLAATLHGKAVGDMVGEAVEQHKRTMRIRNGAITILSALLIAAIFFAKNAFDQKVVADNQRIVAESETRKARLSNYISASQAQLAEDPTKSLRLAEYAYRYASNNALPVKAATEQLIKVVYSGYGFYQQPDNEVQALIEQSAQKNNDEEFNPFTQEINSIIASVEDHFYFGSPRTAIYQDEQSNQVEFLIAGATLDFPCLYFFADPVDEIDDPGPFEIKLDGFSGYTGTIRDVAISSNGQYSILGAANAKTALVDNEAYREDRNDADIFKTRSILMSSQKNPIEDVGFTKDGKYFFTGSERGEFSHYWQAEPFPYIEIRNNDAVEHNNISISGVHYMVPMSEDTEPDYAWFHYAQTIHDQNGTVITEFAESNTGSQSPDGRFHVDFRGVFNENEELLIRLSAFFIDNPGIVYRFSSDSKYFKISYLDGPERIFALDPELILARMNNREIMGEIATLSEEDKRRFLIDVD